MAVTGDSPWRFPLSAVEEGDRDDIVGRSFQRVLESLLSCVDLEQGGRRVQVDGFRFLSEPDRVRPLAPGLKADLPEEGGRPNPLHFYLRSEPRLLAIRELLQALLELVQLEAGGERVEVGAFHLRHPADFQSSVNLSAFDNLAPLSYGCHLKCEFCFAHFFLKYPGMPQTHTKTVREIQERLELYCPKTRRGFPQAGMLTVPWEPMLHPRFLEIMNAIGRRFPGDLVNIDNTNGSLLTEKVVRAIAETGLRVLFTVSLNSSDPGNRRKIMHDPKPEVAINSIPLLHRYGIEFQVSIVALPKLVGMDDILNTIRWSDEYQPHYIRVNLPTYTHLSPQHMLYDDDDWRRIREAVDGIRHEVKAPILVYPALFEEGHPQAQVEGTYCGSLARLAGIERGDEIVAVNGETPLCRTHALQLLGSLWNQVLRTFYLEQRFIATGLSSVGSLKQRLEASPVVLQMRRNGSLREVNITAPLAEAGTLESILALRDLRLHPYLRWRFFSVFGVILAEDFDPQNFARMEETIGRYGARRVLINVARLVRPFLPDLMERSGFLRRIGPEVQLEFITPENRLFGGNVILGDLWVASDVSHALVQHLEGHDRPDLVLLPSTMFNEWEIDLTGGTRKEIEAAAGTPVELVRCRCIEY